MGGATDGGSTDDLTAVKFIPAAKRCVDRATESLIRGKEGGTVGPLALLTKELLSSTNELLAELVIRAEATDPEAGFTGSESVEQQVSRLTRETIASLRQAQASLMTAAYSFNGIKVAESGR